MAVQLSPTQLLDYLTLDREARCVRIRALPPGFQTPHRVGDALDIHTPADGGSPYVRFLGGRYLAERVVRALNKQDPSLLVDCRVSRSKFSDRDRTIWELAKSGLSYADIGERVGGVSRQRVKQILDRLLAFGYDPVNTRAVRQEQRKAVVDMAAQEKARARWGVCTRPDDALVLRLRALRNKALAKGIPFSITAADLLPLPTHCPALGTPLVYELGRGRGAWDDAPSVDRIIPALGYVPGNVVVVSQRANRIKNDATAEELRAIADFYSLLSSKNT